jgi:hypothetical protein
MIPANYNKLIGKLPPPLKAAGLRYFFLPPASIPLPLPCYADPGSAIAGYSSGFGKSSLGFIQFPQPFPRGRVRRKIGIIGDRGQSRTSRVFPLRSGFFPVHDQQHASVKFQPAVIGIDSFGRSMASPIFSAFAAVAVIIGHLEINADPVGFDSNIFSKTASASPIFSSWRRIRRGPAAPAGINFLEFLDMFQRLVVAASDDAGAFIS